MKREQGFTLLELIIVMLLVALLMSLAAAFFVNTLPSSKFNASARELAATIRHAKALAQIDGEQKSLTIDMDSGRYGIGDAAGKTVPEGVHIKVIDPVEGEISTGTYRIVCPPNGSIQGGTIVLWNEKKTATITIDPVAGPVVQ
ncbi:MAG: prepilin-type N-terminal cleavage/methylation domain-containing protein [Nitrospiraceae bacterium]|nr:prepilin-type N-terminal cleavage/methylation domain-containing protein [Nitrospiraceae bacterium]